MTTRTRKIDASITLSASTCYCMKTGKCSLRVVTDYALSPSLKIPANDLLYCPRLLRAMRIRSGRSKVRAVTAAPCECGHAELISGHQRACIASQLGISLPLRLSETESYEACSHCGGQITFDKDASQTRLIRLKVRSAE